MIDFEKIISKYDEKASDAMDMTHKVGNLYSELCKAISDELEKYHVINFLHRLFQPHSKSAQEA